MINQRFKIIDVLRGFLALSVILCHCHEMTNVYGFEFIGGKDSVYCFFIISGFAIVWSILGENNFKLKNYFCKRFLRIYPVYIIATTLMILISYFFFTIRHADSPSPWGLIYLPKNIVLHIINHLFMGQGLIPDNIFPDSTHSLLYVSWSLSVEEQFYLVVLFIMIPFIKGDYKKHFTIIIFLSAFYIVFKSYLGSINCFINYHTYFMIGIFSALSIHNKTPDKFKYLYIGITATLVYSFLNFNAVFIWCLVYGFMILSMKFSENKYINFIKEIIENRVFLFFGKCSYSIYLFHVPVLMLVIYFTKKIFINQDKEDYFNFVLAMTFVITILVSYISYNYIEKVFINFGRKIFDKK